MIDHWFWKYAFENKGSYFQAGIATFFVNIFALAVGFFVMVVYDRIIPNNAIRISINLFIILSKSLFHKNINFLSLSNLYGKVDKKKKSTSKEPEKKEDKKASADSK